MRVLVCGGRAYNDKLVLFAKLNALHHGIGPITCIISGMATGADSLAVVWASANNIDLETYSADWKSYGKGAGAVRNRKMLNIGKPDLVVAFPGGRGTADMVERSRKANVEVIEVK